MGSAEERIAEIEKSIAELKQATEEIKKINAVMKDHLKIVGEEKYAKAEHNGKECKDR